MSSCNRIILIGNGFDLAHGLKTSYNDFIDWYWEKECKDINEKCNNMELDIDTFDEFKWETHFYSLTCPGKLQGGPFIPRYGNELMRRAILKNKFWERIEKELETPYWSGIEDLYYKCLNECRNTYNEEQKLGIEPGIAKLNKEFGEIKELFSEFLETYYDENKEYLRWKEEVFNLTGNITFMPKMLDVILEDFPNMSSKVEGSQSKITLLSFNYTKTPELYAQEIEKRGIQVKTIYIHGELFDKSNPMIFGYGDEMAQESSEIVESKQNEFLKFSKSVLYFQSGQYQELMNSLKGDNNDESFEDYEIFIFGHSCTNGDRTLLRFLFENEHCKRIKYFHYAGKNGLEDFKEKASNIYRIFGEREEEKYNARMRLIPYSQNNNIPQFNTIKAQKEQGRDIIKYKDYVFKKIEGGSLKMKLDNSNENYDEDNNIEFLTTVRSFYLSKYVITQKQYDAVMDSTKTGIYNANLKNHLPVVNVSWFEAVVFCNELSKMCGLEECYQIEYEENAKKSSNKLYPIVRWIQTKKGFRLPTETEWEFAARGGKVSRKYVYAGDDDLSKVGWYYANSPYSIRVIGGKAPNELGLYDMSGNVNEWCWDKFWWNKTSHLNSLKLGKNKAVDSNIDAHEDRVTRGGCFSSAKESCSVSSRDKGDPATKYSKVGFRIVLSIP